MARGDGAYPLPLSGITAGTGGAQPRTSSRLRIGDYLFSAAVAYFLILGGTDLGLVTGFRALNAVLGALVIVLWVRELRRGADLADLLVVLGLLCFEISAALSFLPGFSLAPATSVLAYSALFGLARRRVADARGRRALITTLAVCGGLFVAFFLLAWVPHWISWMALHGPRVPPLDLALPAFTIYNFKYMVAILAAMFVPAFWMSGSTVGARVVAGVLTAAAAVLAIMSGSRSAWLAGAVVLLLLGGLHWRARLTRRRVVLVGGFAALLVIGGWVTGVDQSFADRLLTGSTVSLRFEVWGDALKQFAARPLAGSGPGTFGTMITVSGFFDNLGDIGRGPDGIVIQLLSELGLLGVLGAGLAAGGFWIGVSRARGRDAIYGLSGVGIFAVSALTNDTVTNAQHVGLMVLWAALAAPMTRVELAPVGGVGLRSAVRWLTPVALGVVGIAVAASLVASQLFDLGAQAGRDSDAARARSVIKAAITVDASQGVYWREAGFYDYYLGRFEDARRELAKAEALLPGDATTVRISALNALALGDGTDALHQASQAVDLRRTDEVNLETEAYVASRLGDSAVEREALVAVLVQQPWMAAAPTWQSVFPIGADLAALFDDARAAAARMAPATARQIPAKAWLAAVTGDPEVGTSDGLLALSAWLRCDPDAAQSYATNSLAAVNVDRWLVVGDMVVFRALNQPGMVEDVLRRAGFGPDTAVAYWAENPMPADDPTIDPGEDLRMYGMKLGMRHPDSLVLPGHAEALSAWMKDPAQSVAIGAPGAPAASCSALARRP